jgi:hypothetical protein
MTARTLAVIALVACGSSSDDSPKSEPAHAQPEPAAKTVAVPAPAKPEAKTPPALPALANLFACKPASAPPSIPAIFGAADFGMNRAAAKQAVKRAFKIEEGYGGGWVGFIYTGARATRRQFALQFSTADRLEEFSYSVDQPGYAELVAAWGEPIAYENITTHELAWFDPETKIKAIAHADKISRGDADVDGYHVDVRRYEPLAALLGASGIVAKPVIGKTPAELAALFPGQVEAKSKDEHLADMKASGLDKKTQHTVEAIGAADASVTVSLAETETMSHGALVLPDWAGGKVASYSLLIPFGKDGKLRDEIMAQVVASLGKPIATKHDDTLDTWTFTFAAPNATVVDVSLGIMKDDWHLKVRAK